MSLFTHKTKHEAHHKHHKAGIVDNSALYNTDNNVGPPLPPSHWPDGKLMFCVNPSTAHYQHTTYDKQVAIPLNTVFDIESLLFKGQAICRVNDLPNTDKKYFKGRNRKMAFTFQGQFKRRMSFARIYTGQVFDKPFSKLPGQYVISAVFKILKALAPAIQGDINSTTPHMISPLASAAQLFNIAKPGEAAPLPTEPVEDCSMLDAKFAKMKFTERKAYFHNVDHLKEYWFEPGLVYTMSCYSHMIIPNTYSAQILGLKRDIAQYLPSPIQIATLVLPEVVKDSETGKDDKDSSESKDEMEIIGSEELECESKEDELAAQHKEFRLAGDGDLSKCEFMFNLQMWNTKLLDELWPSEKKKKRKSSGLFS